MVCYFAGSVIENEYVLEIYVNKKRVTVVFYCSGIRSGTIKYNSKAGKKSHRIHEQPDKIKDVTALFLLVFQNERPINVCFLRLFDLHCFH